MKYKFFLLVLLCALQTIAQKQNSIGFIENKGQIVDQKGKENKSVLYLLNTPGLNVQLKKNGFSYDVYEVKKHPLPKQKEDKLPLRSFIKQDTLKSPNFNLEYIYHRIDIDFVNSNSDVKLVSEEKSVDYDNYYNVVHAPNGITNVHKYQKVTYQNIYDNIDVAFFIPTDSTKTVEYNFIVKPGGKISDIQLKFNGAKTELADNKIKMQVRFGEMEETLPLSWIENGANRKEIAVGYRQIKKNVYGFMGDVNSLNKTIVIDPTPVRLWGTYYGGGYDYASSICNDTNNNVYFSGFTWSTINIATTGSYQLTTHSDHYGNGFIAKFNTNGIRLWGIYYCERPQTIKVDTNENLYFTGSALPNLNTSTVGSHQPSHSGSYKNAYLVKLNSAGIREWGTYYGGTLLDYGTDISFDNLNNVYLVGVAGSLNNIGTAATHQPNHSSGVNDDGFIAKFTPQGVRVWGTYFGGTDHELITSSNISDDGFLYVTGNTKSDNGIATAGSHQPNLIGYTSGMIAKFSLDGQLIWGSYFNGSSNCFIVKSKLKDNFLYFTGLTNSHNNINSIGTFNESFLHLATQPEFSSYIVKFDVTSQNQVWGTYFDEHIQDLDVNSNHQVFIEGCTFNPTGIATSGAYSSDIQWNDAYVIKLNENGQRVWGTYYGGNFAEGNNSFSYVTNKLSLDTLGNIYLVGNTTSTTGISTPGAHQETCIINSYGGHYSIYLAKLQDCLSSPQATSNTPCIGSSIQLSASGGTGYSWIGPNNFSSTDQNPIITNANASHSGIYTCAITGTGGCDGTSTVTVTVGNTSPPVPTVATLPNITGDCNTSIITPTATTACSGVINAITANPLTYNVPGTYAIVWNYIDGNGNTATQNQTVIITSQPVPTVTSPQTFCIQENATLNDIAITGQNIKWYDNQTVGNLLANTTQLQNNTTYYASQTIGGCESNRIPVLINIQNTPAPTGSLSQSFCANLNPTLNNLVVQGTNLIWYDSFTGGSVLPLSTALINGATYHVSQTISGCEGTVRLTVTVSLTNSLPANDYAESLCDALNDGSETVNLTNYNSNLITNPSDYSFSYYTSLAGAENELVSDQINNFSNYPLNLGINKVFVRIVSSTTCYKVVELKLNLIASPTVNMQNSYSLCENNSIAISAGSSIGYTYLWSTMDTTPTIVVNQSGNYWVTVSENHNPLICSTRKDFTVVASNSATITNIITADWTNNENTITVLLSDSSIGNYEYSIDGVHYQDSNVFYGLISGAYTVFVKDKHDCGEVSQDLYLLMYPNFFTPNGDGINDHWSIKFSYFEPGLKVKIMDRYGKLITELIHNASWDGTYNGQELPSTDYWFVVTRANGKVHRGHFTLKR